MNGIRTMYVVRFTVVLFCSCFFTRLLATPGPELQTIKLKIALGNASATKISRWVQLKSGSEGLVVSNLKSSGLEKNDRIGTPSFFNCGRGDVDELIAEISWPKPLVAPLTIAPHTDDYSANGNGMWGYLLEKGSPGQMERLKQDQWNQPDAPILTIQLNKEGTEGFSIAVEQLIYHKAMWLPEQDVYITLADQPIGFRQHLASLQGSRTLDSVHQSPEASFDIFRKKWADIGNPNEWNVPWQTNYMGTRGHLVVTAAAQGSIYKFAIDRWANVRPDFASPHRFRLNLVYPNSQWKSQKISNGLPVITTQLEKNGQTMEMEQFAGTVHDLSAAVRGYIPSVLFTQIKISGKSGPVNFGISFNNESPDQKMETLHNGSQWIIRDVVSHQVLFMLEANKLQIEPTAPSVIDNGQQITFNIKGDLADGETKELIIKLPAPAVDTAAIALFNNLAYEQEKEKTIAYWEAWLNKGSRFIVPEEKVNELFRANLWHALILPRHTINDDAKLHMDLPYANTAYGQKNADWPINQAVYVDYMLYGLRGYNQVAEDEIAAMFQSQQQPDGRIGGFANWGVYSPGHLYTIAQNYLLSGNKESFDRLLPQALKTLDWCLAQVRKLKGENGSGLIVGALNDLTHDEREWAFTQAYYVAGLQLFAKALAVYGHPRAEEVKRAAAEMKKDVVEEFSRSSVKSPVVQLADGTWINYVPTDALTPRRMMEQWYPTDVDCGPLHLSRLGAFEPYSWLTTSMLNDHEDNLFLQNLGAANEPVYVPQGNTYLLRDDPKAAIRSFYSLMACGFSHEQFTSLEHRWAWGQYYGPPSTDGAWFELYRRMLINEWGSDTLFIGQAIPRAWLTERKEVVVKNAPTYFGPVSFNIQEDQNDGLTAWVELSNRNLPKLLLIRLRHPGEKKLRSVIVNGKAWKNFDVKKEYIRIPNPEAKKYVITATY